MSDDHDDDDRPPASLELTKTRLAVEGGELVRRNDTGGVTLRLPLDDVEGIVFSRPVNALGITILAAAGGIAAIGYFVAEANVLKVILYVGALLIGMFALIGIREDVVVIRARGGTIRISSPDSTDEVAGFVASVKPLVGDRS